MTTFSTPEDPGHNRLIEQLSHQLSEFQEQILELFNSAIQEGRDLLDRELFDNISDKVSGIEKQAKTAYRDVFKTSFSLSKQTYDREEANIERIKNDMLASLKAVDMSKKDFLDQERKEMLSNIEHVRQAKLDALSDDLTPEDRAVRERGINIEAQDAIRQVGEIISRTEQAVSESEVFEEIKKGTTRAFSEAMKLASIENVFFLAIKQGMSRAVEETMTTAVLTRVGDDTAPSGWFGAGGLGEGRKAVSGLLSEVTRLGPTLMTPVQRIQLFNKVVDQSPRVLQESTENIGDFVGAMGYLGITADESMQLLARATRDIDIDSRDLIDTYTTASMVNREWGLSITDVATQFLETRRHLRGVGAELETIQRIALALPTEALQRQLSPAEIERYSASLGQFLGNLSPTNLAGIMAFSRGGGIPTSQELMGGVEPLSMIQETFQQIQGQFGEEMELYVTEGFAKALGISGFHNLQDIAVLKDILTESVSIQELQERTSEAGFRSTEEIIKMGYDRLDKLVDPMSRILNVLEGSLVPIGTVITELLTAMGPELSKLVITGYLGATIGRQFGGDIGGLALGTASMYYSAGHSAKTSLELPEK